MATYKPTDGMKTAAKRALEWRREYGRGGTAVGVARARDIANGKNLSEETVKRMYSFFSRHETNKAKHYAAKETDGGPTAWRIAWDLWGGSGAFTWSRTIVERLKKDDEERNITNSQPTDEAKDMTDLKETPEQVDELPVEETAERHIMAVEETDEAITVTFGKSDQPVEDDEPRGYDGEEVEDEEMERMLAQDVQQRSVDRKSVV